MPALEAALSQLPLRGQSLALLAGIVFVVGCGDGALFLSPWQLVESILLSRRGVSGFSGPNSSLGRGTTSIQLCHFLIPSVDKLLRFLGLSLPINKMRESYCDV